MKIKWLFFDLGETLYDETLSERQRIENFLEKASANLSYEDFYGQMIKAAEEYEPHPFNAAKDFFGIKGEQLYSSEKEILYEDAVRVIKQLSLSYNLGIIANQPPETKERLKKDGIYDHFKICLISECENLFKPDTRFFEKAIEKAGCKPCEAVMIGDRLDNDIFPAKSIGMKTVRIVQGLHYRQKPRSAEYVPDIQINSLSELLDIDITASLM